MTFKDLGLSEKVLQAVETSGYTTPTPIQAQAIPQALIGRDILGIAQTGTGKTAAFTLPMLSRLEQGRARARVPRTLILEPTRELAAQVEESFIRYGVNHKLNVALLIGGVSFADQEAKITRGADVLIATPGRLLDFFERGKLLLSGIEILVIDEADRMLDMGFIPDIERICKLVPFTRQTLFFSATMPPEITRLADAFLHQPIRIEVARPSSTASTITQALIASASGPAKRETLRKLIRGADAFKNAIIFCNRKRDVAVLHKSLLKHGFNAGALHGDMDQRARMASLDAFKTGDVALLVCSDVAARGLDIPDVSHVFNFDVPVHSEDYVHRIGRTGRAGKNGTAFTIVTSMDKKHIDDIERLIAKPIPWLEGAGPDAVARDSNAGDEASGETSRPRSRGGRGRRSNAEPRSENSRQEGARQEGSRQEGSRHEPRRAEPAEHRRPSDSRRSDDSRRQEPRHQDTRHQDTRHQEPQRQDDPRRQDPRRADGRKAPAGAQPRRPSYADSDERPVVGMGDHVPMFLLRPVKVKPAKVAEEQE